MSDIQIHSLEDFDKLLSHLKGRRRLQEHIISALSLNEADTHKAIAIRNDLTFEIYRLTQIREALEVEEPEGYIVH